MFPPPPPLPVAVAPKVPLLQQPAVPLVVWIGLGADLLGMALIATLLLYAFPLMVYQDADMKTSLRNGWLLAALHPWHTLGLLGLGILFAFGVGYLSLGLLFLLPTFYGMFVMGNALLVLQSSTPVEPFSAKSK